MPLSLRPFIQCFALLAALGLALSLLSHIAALLGSQGPLGDYAWILHIGIFVVWLPAVLVANRLTAGCERKDFWKAALRGCPPWMKYLAGAFFLYALINFVTFIANAPPKAGSGAMPPSVVRGFSGHWMAFYSAAMAVLYSAAHVKESDAAHCCANGHTVRALAKFCDQCGQPVVENSAN